MCLSSVYQHGHQTDMPLFQNAAKVHIQGTELTFIDLMGRCLNFSGMITNIDLLENKIVVEGISNEEKNV